LFKEMDDKSNDFMSLKYPFFFLFDQQWFQLLLLLWGVTECYLGASTAQKFQDYGVSSFKSYRIYFEPPRDVASFSLQATSFLEWAIAMTLLHRGCMLPSPNFTENGSTPAQFSITFPAPQNVDGFRLDLRPRAAAAAPLPIPPFLLQGTNDDGAASPWTDVGAPRFRLTPEGVRLLRGDGGGGGAVAVDARGVAFDLRAPWPLAVLGAWVPLATGLFLLCAAACGAAGRAGLGGPLTVGFLAFLAANLAAIGATGLDPGP
jgi:hypothetical protein